MPSAFLGMGFVYLPYFLTFLAQKFLFCCQIISLDVNLSGQKDRVAELEQEIQELKQQHSESGEPEREEVRAGDRLRVHELELERASLKQELSVSVL